MERNSKARLSRSGEMAKATWKEIMQKWETKPTNVRDLSAPKRANNFGRAAINRRPIIIPKEITFFAEFVSVVF